MTSHILLPGDAGAGTIPALAREIGERVVAVHVGTPEQAAALATSGVDEVITLTCEDPAEDCAAAVVEVLSADPGVILAGRDPVSRVLLGAAAAALEAPVFTDVSEVTRVGGITRISHGLCGGIANRVVEVNGPVAVLVDGGGTTTGSAPVAVTTHQVRHSGITAITTHRSGDQTTQLSAAARVVAVGRGLRSRDDMPLITDLAAALDAELGGTRPLAEGLDWLPRDRYIGISGQRIAPELYVAVGISGQLQHIAGARRSGTIVAVNTDENAPIAAEADYLLVGDLHQVVPALTAALRSPS